MSENLYKVTNAYNVTHISRKTLRTVFTKILNYILSQSSVVKCHRISSDSFQRRSKLWVLQQVTFLIKASIRLNKKLATIYTKTLLIKLHTLYRRLGCLYLTFLTLGSRPGTTPDLTCLLSVGK